MLSRLAAPSGLGVCGRQFWGTLAPSVMRVRATCDLYILFVLVYNFVLFVIVLYFLCVIRFDTYKVRDGPSSVVTLTVSVGGYPGGAGSGGPTEREPTRR